MSHVRITGSPVSRGGSCVGESGDDRVYNNDRAFGLDGIEGTVENCASVSDAIVTFGAESRIENKKGT
jgi:hypothetical protein